ncbi:leucine-rich repeat domain-containing protein [Thalassotalea psychrophila]|uniref:Leucine-rich repeat domain-containing protein n=1 Tax=Thalassotalea psychrophila TaxID=3065647 RepID=A0ABY9TYB9_9GAMM|nr:leucine-rich repeat domain-containing protein [Colwelliaceae bacterium SQ149]
MKITNNYKKIVQCGCFLTTTILAGCGGGGGGNAPEVTNIAPEAEIIGANLATEHDLVNFKAQADDIDGVISSYSWSVEGTNVELTGANTANLSFIAPSVEQDTSFTIHLTVTDDDGATVSKSMNFTSERIFDSLVIRGLVKDKALIHPEVTLDIGDEQYTTTGTAAGVYTFNDVIVDERNFDQLVKLTAVGHEDYNPGVKLVSLLESFRTLKTYDTSQEYILAIDYFGLNVTNVTTAKYALALAANDNQPITTERRLNELLNSLNSQQVFVVAGLLKVIIDHEEHTLPNTVSDTLSLVLAANHEVYKDTLRDISAQGNVLTTAIEATLGDPDLVENPDFDGDGIVDSEDGDDDNDGVLDEDDFFDRDNTKSSPELGMIQYPWDGTYGSWLEFCVRESVNIPHIGTDDFKPLEYYKSVPADEVTEIYCNGTELSDLSMLKHFPNLKILQIADTDVDDISTIAQASQLEHLLLQNTKVSNFSPLSDLVQLKTLNLASTKIADLAALTKLVNLEVLNVSGTNIADLAAVSAFSNLKQLDISASQVTDLSELVNLTKLQLLYAHQAKIATLADFSKLTLLTEFTLYNNLISNIDPLATLSATSSLDLSHNKIADFSALANLTNLTELDLSHNEIANTAALSSLVKLTHVNLAYNQLSSVNGEITAGSVLNGLSNLTLLTDLNLSNNQLDSSANDLQALSALVGLSTLDISNNNFENITPVNLFTLLTDFDASGNNIVSINDLANLTTLIQLDLAKNELVDITPLSKLTNLTTLLLSHNRIDNIDVLNNWLTLPLTLWLDGDDESLCAPADPSSPVELLQIKADEQSIAYKGPCANYISRLAIVEPEQFLTIIDQDATDLIHSAGVSNLGDYERVACMNQIHDGYPLCWISNNANFFFPQCTAEENAPLMTCSDGPEEGIEWPPSSGNYWKTEPFTVDYDFTLQANNQFVSNFENRLILTLVKSSFVEVDINCSALNAQGLASCELSGDYFVGTISWTQDHEDETYPRCSAEIGSSIATCTPGPSTAQIKAAAKTIDQLPVLNTEYNFDIDFSQIEITPVQDRDYPCISGALCW